MNTLDKIAKLEAEVSMLKQMMSSMPSDAQTLSSVNQNVSILADNQKQNVERTNQIFTAIGQKQDLVVQRIMSIEQSFSAITKTLQALVEELQESHSLNAESVLKRIRTQDEKAEMERINQMLALEAIEEVEEVTKDSTIVVSQRFTLTSTGEVKEIADYRVFELNSGLNDEETVAKFLGKKVGDTVESQLQDGTLKTSILKVYNEKEVSIQQNVQDSVS